MKKRRTSFMAMMLAAVFLGNPVLAAASYPFTLEDGLGITLLPMPELKAKTDEINIQQARMVVAKALVDLGREKEEARTLANLLTANDIKILLANPAMMQEAGAMSAQTRNLIAGLLVLGGLIALAAAGDGFIVQ